MVSFETAKRFRDRGGKELKNLTAKQLNDLKVYEVGKVYESDDAKWTDYLVKKGFLKSTGTKTTTVKKEEKPKRTSSKKSGE
ncbi:MAG: hypothetical protein ABS896_09285 [Carnobacterium inhibens]|uniref:hypothetical protein n=1 Tax=Carnobacterium inhibens TaxID=147709 RepID=UPI0033157B10